MPYVMAGFDGFVLITSSVFELAQYLWKVKKLVFVVL